MMMQWNVMLFYDDDAMECDAVLRLRIHIFLSLFYTGIEFGLC